MTASALETDLGENVSSTKDLLASCSNSVHGEDRNTSSISGPSVVEPRSADAPAVSSIHWNVLLGESSDSMVS